MAYDKHLADKITRIVSQSRLPFYEKEMMGAITWMVNDKMSVSIIKGNLMVRVDPDEVVHLLTRTGATQKIHSGKTMTGFLTIAPEGFDFDTDLEFWVQKCLEYNPKAKASKKKKK